MREMKGLAEAAAVHRRIEDHEYGREDSEKACDGKTEKGREPAEHTGDEGCAHNAFHQGQGGSDEV